MRRFVYGPQLECYIRNEATQTTVDLTDDIISGTVTRRLNAVSEAQLTIQNKLGKYTESIRFDPMDRIVIRASRVGEPFMIFSGFLDEVPLAQLYPQPVSLRASCTLKLLQHTYFDPGLPTLISFFLKHGWLYNPATGALFSNSGSAGNLDLSKGMGAILKEILIEPMLGNWVDGTVDIRDLPDSFIENIATVMQKAAAEEHTDWEDLADKLRNFLSVSNSSDSTNTSGDNSQDTGGVVHPATGNVDPVDIAGFLLDAGAGHQEAADLIAIAHRESGFLSDAINFNGGGDGSSGDGSYDLGLFQLNTIHAPSATNNGRGLQGPASSANHNELISVFRSTAPTWAQQFADRMFTPKLAAQNAVSIDDSSHSAWRPGGSQPWDTGISTEWKQDATKAVAAALQNKGKSGATVTIKPTKPTQSVQQHPDEGTRGASSVPDVVVQRKAVGSGPFYPLGKVGTNGGGPAEHRTRAFGNWESDEAIDILVDRDTPVIAIESGTIGFTGYTPQGPDHHKQNVPDSTVVAGFSNNPAGYGVYLEVNGVNKYWYGHLHKVFVQQGKHVNAGDTIGLSGAANGINHLHLGVNTASDAEVINITHNTTTTGTTPPGGYAGDDTSDNTGTTLSGPLTAEQVAAIARQSVWFTTQLQGGDVITSTSLMGKRALANDISLLNWISELVPASGRVFTSKPNGEFLSFFPDYWGWFERTPYFEISDIEIIDLNLMRSDDNLTTHVFAVGPQFSSDITMLDRMLSMVASVEEPAFNMFINVDDDSFEPLDFLKRYGARPYSEDMPNIKHPILLWIKAWMKFTELWSKQFSTPAQFTFMPELFPGGLVSFGGRLQMFVEEITHNFSWESGFTTSATLSSPAALNDDFPMLPRAGQQGIPMGDASPLERRDNG